MSDRPTYEDLEKRIHKLEKIGSECKQAEDALRESVERFKDLADLLPEAVFETDVNFNLTFANKKAHELTGYSKQDF